MSDLVNWLLQEVSDVQLVFPATVSHLMPPWNEIPEKFKTSRGTPWNELVSKWFFTGVSIKKYKPKDGIDTTRAMRHIKTIMGSFEPKHEHKEAACAYLLSCWFDKIVWE